MNQASTTCQGHVSQWCSSEVAFLFLQANHNWGRRAESQRAECHVHWDQCQDRLQCQTGDSCTSPTFRHIWNTSVPLLVTVTPTWVYTTHINTAWLLVAHLLVCSSAISFSQLHKSTTIVSNTIVHHSAVTILIYYIKVHGHYCPWVQFSEYLFWIDFWKWLCVCVIFICIFNSVLFLLCECSVLRSAVPSCCCSPTWNGKLGWCKSWRQYP